MAIVVRDDIGAPAVVTVVDLVTEAKAPDINEWISYIMAAGSYIAASMGAGGNFVKNMGIASFPWAAKSIYERVRGGASRRTGSRMRLQPVGSRVGRYPAPAEEKQFQGVRLV